MVVEVDCTAEGKPLCDANGVQGFPTLKYGDFTALEDYQGGRSYDDLAAFAKDNITKKVCSPANIDVCPDDKKAEIEKYMAMSDADIEAAITEGEAKIAGAEETFKTEVEKLQAAYQQLRTDQDAAIAEVKASGLSMMKAVKASKKDASKDEL